MGSYIRSTLNDACQPSRHAGRQPPHGRQADKPLRYGVRQILKPNRADITVLISRLYIGSMAPLCCEENGDLNCDDKMNLSDITQLICYVYVDPENCEPCLCEELP